MHYSGAVYRPPSEARSLIVQCTLGCSHNKCAFCTMYKDKKFSINSIEQVLSDLDEARAYGRYIEKIFLADGDALILPMDYLLTVLDYICDHFPTCKRVAAYATTKAIMRKTDDELRTLREHGLGIVYIGLESGNEELLKKFCKGVTAEEIVLNAIRCKLGKHHFTLFMCIAVSVSSACLVYAGFLKLAELLFHISVQHEAGYICSMLFIIPGFPFITSGIDLAKLDMRSGLERLAYAIIVVMVAAVSAWLMALLLHLKPVDFLPLELSAAQRILFRLLASFCGVFGFSVMFNSPVRLAAAAAFIGALSNTLRLELVDLAGFPPAAAAFFGALTAGLLASLIKTKVGYPRISITVPSIVIMVPGLYLYRAIYNLGIMSLNVSASWFAAAILIIVALPLGLIFARILTDKMFRYCT